MKKVTKFVLIGSTLNLILNIILINKIGAYGAAISTVIAEGIITILCINGTDGFVKWKEIFNIFIKKVIAGIVMLCVILILNKMLFNISKLHLLSLEILCGTSVYCILLAILKDTSISVVISFLKSKILKKGGNY